MEGEGEIGVEGREMNSWVLSLMSIYLRIDSKVI